MTGRGSNLDSNLKKVPSALKSQNKVWSLSSFQKDKNMDSCESILTLIHQTVLEGYIEYLGGQYTVCRQCTTCVLCSSCLSQFQICVCFKTCEPAVTFSQCQSVSIVTKSLSSPACASCQSEEHMNSCVFRQHEAMHISIQIKEICSRGTGLCSSRIPLNIRMPCVEYLPSCRKIQ